MHVYTHVARAEGYMYSYSNLVPRLPPPTGNECAKSYSIVAYIWNRTVL